MHQPSPSSSTEKVADISDIQARISISLTKQSTRPHIQQQIAKVKAKSSKTFRLESKVVRKLHEGIANGDYSMVCKALSEKADPNGPIKGSKVAPIHRALSQAEAALGCEDEIASRDLILIVMALILGGADLREVDDDRRTPLIRAVKGEMGDGLVALMMEYGASVNATDKERNTALHYAAMQQSSAEMRNTDTIRTLIAFGADLGATNQRGRTPLYKAVMWQHMDQAVQLLDYGSDLEVADNNGWTPLYGAVLQGHVPLTKLLCERGAFVDKKDKTGQTALHYAVSQGRQEIVEVLVNAGADVNLISKGETPLCRATAKMNGALITYLLSHGADVAIPSPGYNGALPIHIAAIGKDPNVLTVLINAGSFIDAQDGAGRTPLAWAAEAGRDEIVHFLMSKGAHAEV
jgi:ankyrin repeat protein